jgi:hypothetical protein
LNASNAKRPTRKEGRLVHLCPGAWEVVRKPKVRELSIVASPAYENTSFQPLGFYAAMNEAQWGAIIESLTKSGVLEPSPSQSSVSSDDNVGSKPAGLQEPETKTVQKAGRGEALCPLTRSRRLHRKWLRQQSTLLQAKLRQSKVEYEDFMKAA